MLLCFGIADLTYLGPALVCCEFLQQKQACIPQIAMVWCGLPTDFACAVLPNASNVRGAAWQPATCTEV